MNKLILLTSVAILSFGAISESRAECAAGLIACGDDCAATGATCHWEIDSSGKLSITGSGAMKENFGNRKITENTKANGKLTTAASWGDYYNQITSIEIGEGITDTGARAFQGLSNVTSVNIPKSLTTLGALSFDRQPDLVNFNVPEGSKLTNFGGIGAFQFSSSLSNTSAQKVLDTISANNKVNGTTFELPANSFGNSGLTSITIPEGVTSIGDYAFNGASSLTSITLPEGVTSIGTEAFYNASSLTSITLPEGVTSIGDSAFFGAKSLTSITLPGSLTEIGSNVFVGSGIKNVNCAGTESKCATLKTLLDSRLQLKNGRTFTRVEPVTKCSSYTSSGVCNACYAGYALGNGSCHACGTGKNCHWDDTAEKVVFDGCKDKYLRKENECVASSQGCGANFRLNDGYCDRIRYTPAEAAKVLKDDNTNVVTITFKM